MSSATRKRGIAKPRLVFSLGKDREILTDGVQWIFQDGNDRGYYTSLETVCKKIIDLHFRDEMELSDKGLKNIEEVRDLMKRAWAKCKELAEAIKKEAAIVQGG